VIPRPAPRTTLKLPGRAPNAAVSVVKLEFAQPDFPAGVTRFELRAKKEAWKGGPDIRKITFNPTTPQHP